MNAFYNEIEPYAADWLVNLAGRGHIAPGAVERRSIADLKPSDIGDGQAHFFAGLGGWSRALRRAGVPDDAPIWTGSCPCQPFSVAGRRGGRDDERHLWPAWFDLIRERRPSIIFGEQVASSDGLDWLDAVSTDLEGSGYAFGAADLCAAGVGAPHLRQRLYFVAYTRDERLERLRLHVQRWRSQPPRLEARRGGQTDPVANSDERGLPDGAQASVPREQPHDGGSGRDGAMANPARAQREGRERGELLASGRWRSPDGGETGTMGDSGGDRDIEHTGKLPSDESEHDQRPAHGHHTSVAPGATRGFWSDAEWIPCSDGRSRPAQPGAFPLAHGVPGRVGRLRAYGNAIVPEVAVPFIESALAIIELGG